MLLVGLITVGLHLLGLVVFGAFKVVEAVSRQAQSFEAPEEVSDSLLLESPPVELLRRVRESSVPRPQPIAVEVPEVAVPAVTVDLNQVQPRLGRGYGVGFGDATTSIRELSMELSAIEFFGQEFNGDCERILFIIDMSASMIDPRIRGIDGYQIVVSEVVRTLESLPRGSFNLIAFAGAVEVYRGGFAAISPGQIEDARRWLLKLDPAPGRLQAEALGQKPNWSQWKGGRNTGTRTDLALEVAFSKRPGSIILLSDGLPSKVSKAEIFEMVAGWRSDQAVPIHTVSYKSRSGGEFLRELAERSEGTYKAVE